MDASLFLVLVGSVVVAALARWRGWPAPLLVTGVALAVSLLPFVPDVSIDGELLLTLTLPPLLYSAALDASYLSFKRSMPHVRRLGIWLVAVTTLAVGLVAWLLVPALTLPAALLLGAIVGPPDAVSAAAIGRKLGLPRRVMDVLSGESLINDATSLTLVRVFAAIVAGASVTVWEGLGEFGLAVALGVGVGLLFGFVLHALRMRFSDVTVTNTFGLLMPFGAYVIAEHIGGSGVLAVVAMGFYVGYHRPRTSYVQRQQESPLWHSVDLLLESFVFAYVGLQLPYIVETVIEHHGIHVLGVAMVVLVVVLAVRPVFVFLSYWWGQTWEKFKLRRRKRAIEAYHRDPNSPRARSVRRRYARMRAVRVARGLPQPTREQMKSRYLEPKLSWQERTVISWAGMRGVVTLALAAALPELTQDAMPEGDVEVIIGIAFVVTIGTLLLQGLTLPILIRRLGVSSDEEHAEDRRGMEHMRELSREAGIAYLDEQRDAWRKKHGDAGAELFARFAGGLLRVEHDTDQTEKVREEAQATPADAVTYDDLVALSKGWLAVRRGVLLDQRRAGNLSEEVMREMFVAMDAEELALDTRGALREE